jgi:hypothetical protein
MMNAMDLIRAVTGDDGSTEDPHPHNNRHHFALEPLELELRQLLSAVQAPTSSDTHATPAIGATGVLGTAGEVTPAAASSTVQTITTGGTSALPSQVPASALVADLGAFTANVEGTAGSVAVGPVPLPITALLPVIDTENETPLNNGTPIDGTVWITPAPVAPGVFHPTLTAIPAPAPAAVTVQTPNPQAGPPTFTHLGQGANGAQNTTATQESVAVGPDSPSISEEVQPVQPPPVGAHPPAGPPVQVPQDETAPPQGAANAPAGQQGKNAGQQQGTKAPPTGQPTTPNGSAGQGQQGGGGAQGSPDGGAGESGSSSSGGAADLDRPHLELPGIAPDSMIDLIDAAIPTLASRTDPDSSAGGDENALPPLFGVAAVAAGGFRLVHRGTERRRGALVQGPSEADGGESRRAGGPPSNN